MKSFNLIKYAVGLTLLFFLSCTKDTLENVHVYFKEKSFSLAEDNTNAIEIPVNIFSNGTITEDITINYIIEGEGSDRLNDISGGSIAIKKGFKAYIAYISIAAINNDISDGDAIYNLKLVSTRSDIIVGLGSNNTNQAITLNLRDDDVSCIAEVWQGNLSCADIIYPSYSPSTASGKTITNDCQNLTVSFNFWDDGNLPVVLKLELGALNKESNSGTVNLLEDYKVVGSGYNISFFKGDAGTYNLNTGELKLVLDFDGYDIGGDGKYRFTLKK